MISRARFLIASVAAVALTPVAVLAVLPAGAATVTPQSWGARVTCTADASGFCTVAHPAGTVPDAVTVTPELPAMTSVDQLSASSFRVRFCRAVSSTGACTALTGSRAFYAHVDWTPGGSSPSPSQMPGSSAPVSPVPSSAPASPSVPPSPTASAGAFPDAASTGVPAGTALTVLTGDQTVTVANTVIDAKDIRGCVEVRATGVVIKRSKISASCFYVIYSHVGQSVTVQDSEIDCANTTSSTALGDTGVTALRVNVHGCENGFDIDANVTVQDSYIHDLANSSASHTDGIQLASDAGSNVAITHNSIDGGAGTSAIIMNTTGANGVTVQDNRLAGGAFTLYCPRPADTNVRILNNRFVRTAAYGPWDACQDEAQVAGNVWDDTGAPLAP